ncbi:hypothetical protein IJU97_04465 [bacterium]|nr:hypothetical protein [bacterium]
MLVDKQFSESYLSIDPKTLIPEPPKRGEKTQAEEKDTYKRYEITEN